MSIGLDLTALLVAALSGMGGVFAVMQSRAANAKAAALERRKIDRQETQDHWARTDDIIARLQEEVARLDSALRLAREALAQAHTDNAALRGRVDECELRIVRLKAIVSMLADELRKHGLPVPGHVD